MIRLIYIFGPALVMIVMALIQLYILPLVVLKPWDYQLVWMLLGLILVAFITLRWYKTLNKNLFFLWGSLLAVAAIVFGYLGANLSGLIAMGSHDEFPGIIIILPTIGLLLLISLSNLIISLLKRFRDK